MNTPENQWQRTFGKAVGSFFLAPTAQLYVRRAHKPGEKVGSWLAWVDGVLVDDRCKSETAAQAEAEASLRRRDMVAAGAAAVTAAAGDADRAASA